VRRPVLAVAARHDGSGGLRAVLRVLDAHAAPLCAAAAALGAAQAACLVAAAAYGSRTPLAARAQTAGCWAR